LRRAAREVLAARRRLANTALGAVRASRSLLASKLANSRIGQVRCKPRDNGHKAMWRAHVFVEFAYRAIIGLERHWNYPAPNVLDPVIRTVCVNSAIERQGGSRGEGSPLCLSI